MNDYDSGRIADLLNAEMGYERTDVLEEADLVVVNTCSIREKAQEKTFSDLGRIREVKKTRPGMLIAVGGCVASQEGENVIRRAPCVDVVFGPQTLHRLPDMLRARVETGRPQVDVSFPEIEKFDHLPAPKAHGAAAFVSIMEGCSKYCSYCVVPYTRGEEISRPMVDVLMEVAQLADQGVREVTLLGQNVNAYRGKMPDGSIADFALLLDYVSEIDGIERIRYTTSHPREFSQRIIDAYGRLPKLVMFTIPVYVAMYLMQHYGLFRTAEAWLSDHTPWLGFIRPEALGIVLLSLAAEIGASLSAAGSALHMGGLTPPEVIIALLVGNILSTPMRTVRHQFPAYAGYYSPGLAFKLIFYNQLLRTITMIGVTWAYWLCAIA